MPRALHLIMRLLEIIHNILNIQHDGNDRAKSGDNNYIVNVIKNLQLTGEACVVNKMKQNDNRNVSEDVKGDNKKLKAAEQEFIVGAESTSDDDNSPHTIKSAIDLAESESARNREQNTLPPNVA